MNRRTSIKSILAASFLGASIYSNCTWRVYGNQIELLYSYKGLIAELAETIIPATDTPGSKDAQVENFIINVLAESDDSRIPNKFLMGLRDLQDYSKMRYGKIFQSCSSVEKNAILEYYESKSFRSPFLRKISERLFGESFFYILKILTVIGFCTSRIGATEALVYDFLPIEYQACIQLKKGQRAWATN